MNHFNIVKGGAVVACVPTRWSAELKVKDVWEGAEIRSVPRGERCMVCSGRGKKPFVQVLGGGPTMVERRARAIKHSIAARRVKARTPY